MCSTHTGHGWPAKTVSDRIHRVKFFFFTRNCASCMYNIIRYVSSVPRPHSHRAVWKQMANNRPGGDSWKFLSRFPIPSALIISEVPSYMYIERLIAFGIYYSSGCVYSWKETTSRTRVGNRGDVIKFSAHQHIGPAGRYDRRDILSLPQHTHTHHLLFTLWVPSDPFAYICILCEHIHASTTTALSEIPLNVRWSVS